MRRCHWLRIAILLLIPQFVLTIFGASVVSENGCPINITFDIPIPFAAYFTSLETLNLWVFSAPDTATCKPIRLTFAHTFSSLMGGRP